MVGVGAVPVVIRDTAGNSLYSAVATIPLAVQPQVTMTTSMGTMVLELNPTKAPISVDNFLNYVEAGFYVNKIFHRVTRVSTVDPISTIAVIQAGGYTADLVPAATQAAIPLEAYNSLSNVRGSLAMARLAAADSATSQFFINSIDNIGLDASGGGYAVFGKVITGLDVMDKIQAVATGARGGLTDVPTVDILITGALQTK
ncbi:MAG: peptidylprolyl isomerase [Undibacterium sp.]|nr:peptidylprolyl isomerase [Undibacterium sp.]